MPGYSEIDTLVTPGGTISFNDDSGDTLFVNPKASSGLALPKVRAPIDNRGQTDGYLLHTFFLEGRHLVLAGAVLIRSAPAEAGYVTARDALTEGTETKLRTILAATGTLTLTGGGSVEVKCELCDFPAAEGVAKEFVIGLVSASAAQL